MSGDFGCINGDSSQFVNSKKRRGWRGYASLVESAATSEAVRPVGAAAVQGTNVSGFEKLVFWDIILKSERLQRL